MLPFLPEEAVWQTREFSLICSPIDLALYGGLGEFPKKSG
jgi:hypothetical protein